jgi:hypothetical protein
MVEQPLDYFDKTLAYRECLLMSSAPPGQSFADHDDTDRTMTSGVTGSRQNAYATRAAPTSARLCPDGKDQQ